MSRALGVISMRTDFYQTLMLMSLCIGSFLTLLDANILTIALPAIQDELGGTIHDMQWVVDGYVLSSASLLIGMGAFADILGARRMYLTGLAGFAVFSLMCSLAWSMPMLIVGRMLLGIAGAMLLPSSLALINHTYMNKRAHSKAMGVWAALSGLAMAVGPLLGGFLAQYIGWRAVFAAAIPFAIIGLIMVWQHVKEAPIHKRPVSVVTQLLVFLTAGALAYGLIQGSASSFGSLQNIIAYAMAIVGALLLWRNELRSDNPLVPRSVFTHREIMRASLLGALANFGLIGFTFYVAFYLQAVRELSMTQTSLAFLALTLPLALNPPRSARLVRKVGPYKPLVGGFLLLTLATMTLLLPVVRQSLLLYLLCMLSMGIAITYIIPPLTILTMQQAPVGLTGIVSAILNASRQYGTLLGVAAIGIAMGSTTSTMNVILPLVVIVLTFAVGFIVSLKLKRPQAN